MATLLSNKSPNVWQQPVKLSRKHERTNSYLERDALPTLHCFVVERLLKKKKKALHSERTQGEWDLLSLLLLICLLNFCEHHL